MTRNSLLSIADGARFLVLRGRRGLGRLRLTTMFNRQMEAVDVFVAVIRGVAMSADYFPPLWRSLESFLPKPLPCDGHLLTGDQPSHCADAKGQLVRNCDRFQLPSTVLPT